MFHRLFCKYRLDWHFQSQSGSRPKKSPISNHQITTVVFSFQHVTPFFLFTYRIRIFVLHSHRRYPLLQINLHIVFLHTFIFSELLNLFVMSDNDAFLSTLKLRKIFRPRRSSKLFLLLDVLTFSVLLRESYLLYTVVFDIFNKPVLMNGLL